MFPIVEKNEVKKMSKNAFWKDAKIDLQKIIDDAITAFIDIRESDDEQRRKTEKEKRLAATIKRLLHTDGRKKEESKIALNTYNRYLTKIRRALTATGFKHHTFEKKLDSIIAKNKKSADALNQLKSLNATECRRAIKAIIAENKLSTDAKVKSMCLSLSKLDIVPVLLKSLSLDETDGAEIEAKKETAIVKKQSKLVKLDGAKITSLIATLLNSKAPQKLALGVALATGRRAIEVLIQGNFMPAKDGTITFTGQAKERAKDGEKIEVTIYPLADSELVLSAVTALRASEAVKTIASKMQATSATYSATEQFNNFSREFTIHASQLLGEALGSKPNTERSAFNSSGWTFKDSRAIYARMSYEKYKTDAMKNGGDLMDDSLFFSAVLGHTDTDAQRSYRAFYMSGDVTTVTKEVIAAVAASEDQVISKARLERFEAIQRLARKKTSQPYKKLFERLIEALHADMGLPLTTSYMRKNLKGRAAKIGEFVSLIRDAKIAQIID